ncbi:MAG: hypothetical protein AAF456_21460 [Planctomycetota bacterium]
MKKLNSILDVPAGILVNLLGVITAVSTLFLPVMFFAVAVSVQHPILN